MSYTLRSYKPNDMEAEKASNAYLMSVIAIMVGMPLPIVNLLATVIFYFGNRKSTYFVRWHCTQTLVSQMTLLIVNSISVSWTLSIAFGPVIVTNRYIAFLICIVLLNLFEFIVTIAAAIRTRKGVQTEWWFAAEVAYAVCREDKVTKQVPGFY